MIKEVLGPQDWNFINNLLKNNKITVIDNFFTQEILSILKIRALYAKHCDNHYGIDRYYSINYSPNQDHITTLIAKELKKKVSKLPEFRRGWSFVYNNESKGVELHADPSEFNINIWVSGDESVKNKSLNGLYIYKITPPADWERKDWNGNVEKVKKYLDAKNIKPEKIDYKSNRAIIFNGAYFHKSNDVSMKEGVENRRVSYTMLFGSQLI